MSQFPCPLSHTIIPTCPYFAYSPVLAGCQIATEPISHLLLLILLTLSAHELPKPAPVISFTHSAHSFHPGFFEVICFSRVGIRVPSGAKSSSCPLAHFQLLVALRICALATAGSTPLFTSSITAFSLFSCVVKSCFVNSFCMS